MKQKNVFYYDALRCLNELNVSGFDTSSAVDMSSMFENCDELMELDISNFNTKMLSICKVCLEVV